MNERGDGGTQAAPRSHAEREGVGGWGAGAGRGGERKEGQERGREAVGRAAGRGGIEEVH